MASILIIEDNPDIGAVLQENLIAESYQVHRAETGAAGAALARRVAPDVILLDLMLPDIDGEEVLAGLRSEGIMTPVLILSARTDEATKVAGFRTGADDYVTKPFGLLELLARIHNLARRQAGHASPHHLVRLGSVEVDGVARRVMKAGVEIALRPKEMDLLLALLRRPNRAVSRTELLRQVWNYDPDVESRTIDWHVAELRRKLEDDAENPVFLHTVRKVGYRLDLPGSAG